MAKDKDSLFITLMALRINCLEFSHFEWLSRFRDVARAGHPNPSPGWRGLGFGWPAIATSLYLDKGQGQGWPFHRAICQTWTLPEGQCLPEWR